MLLSNSDYFYNILIILKKTERNKMAVFKKKIPT